MLTGVPSLLLVTALSILSPLAQSATCDDQAACPETAPVTLTPDVQVAGVQTSADDARQPGESEPFIINDGFGD